MKIELFFQQYIVIQVLVSPLPMIKCILRVGGLNEGLKTFMRIWKVARAI